MRKYRWGWKNGINRGGRNEVMAIIDAIVGLRSKKYIHHLLFT